MRLLTRSLIRTSIWSLLLAIGLTLGFASVAGAQTAFDPLATYTASINATNTEDVEGGLNTFTDDAVVKLSPTEIYTGKAEIRKWRERAKVTHDRIEIVGPSKVSGNKLTTVIRLVNTETKAAGFDYLELTQEVTYQDGKIKELIGTPTPETLRKLQSLAPAIPATGQGQSSQVVAGTNFDLSFALAVAGLLSLVALLVVRRNLHRIN